MDILKPEYVWIENKCYRLLAIKDKVNVEEDFEPSFSTFENDDDEKYDTELPIIHHGDRFYITIHVPRPLICHVRGKYSRMKLALEKYGAKLDIPSDKNSSAPITITSSSKKAVSDVYHRIESIVNTNRFREESTHFISIPINSEEIQEKFLEFKKKVLKECKVRGIEESIFQNPSKLHLTITVLVLLDERDKQEAEAVLMKCKENILKNYDKQIAVQVKGIEYMNDDPAEVDVLYAKLQEVDDDNMLQLISDNILTAFVNANLSKSKYDKVKLHITLMDSLYRKKKDGENDERSTFNAQPVLQKFGDYEFGQLIISEIHISVRYSTANDGYYIAVCKMKLNS